MSFKFVVITNRGYWGKADTLKQALKNAGGFPAEVIVYRYPETLVKLDSIAVNGMGGVEFKYTELGVKVREDLPNLHNMFKMGNFDVSKQLNMKPVE